MKARDAVLVGLILWLLFKRQETTTSVTIHVKPEPTGQIYCNIQDHPGCWELWTDNSFVRRPDLTPDMFPGPAFNFNPIPTGFYDDPSENPAFALPLD